MKKTYWLRFALFILLLGAIDWGLSILLSIGFHHTECGESTGAFVNKARQVKADVVVFGNSRAQCHYNPLILEKTLKRSVYNAGANGQGIPYVQGVADLLLKDYKPYLFIINVDAELIAVGSYKEGFDRVAVLSPFIDDSNTIRKMIYSRSTFEWIKYISLSFRYNGKALGIINNLFKKDETISGFTPLEKVLNPNTIPKHAFHAKSQGSADPRMINLLRETIQQARMAGTRVILVTSPWWTWELTIDPFYANLFNEVEKIAQEENVPYVCLNLENTPTFHDPSLFADAAHLNSHGSTLFTEMIACWLAKNGYADPLNLPLKNNDEMAAERSHIKVQ